MTPFEDLTDLYEAVIDWPKRLAREEPFYRRLFAQTGTRRVLDAACGTGRHACMFHDWGLSVEAADIAPRMLDRARLHRPPDARLTWTLRSFDQPVQSAPFDIAICVGNSLALAPTLLTVQTAIAQMLHAVRPGGSLVIQVLNLWSIPEGPMRWQPPRPATFQGQQLLVTRGVHRCGPKGFVEFLITNPADRTQSAPPAISFLGLERDTLERIALESGAATTTFFGGYAQEPYVQNTSTDLLMIATRGPARA
ncbi:MAG: class I SAM-dependent methyltransferase [Phycisphaerae bacterium]